MWNWLKPRCPLGTAEKVWIETRLAWLAEKLGSERMLKARVVEPTEEFFPRQFHGTPEEAEEIFQLLLSYMQIDPTPIRLIVRHLIPNILGPAFVQMAFAFGSVILIEATLSFLGLGPHVPYTWGAMLDQGTTFLWREGFVHYALLPGLAIMWVVLGANLLADGLRDRFDPRQRGRQ